jgi:hypothetical protein
MYHKIVLFFWLLDLHCGLLSFQLANSWLGLLFVVALYIRLEFLLTILL